MKIFYAQSLYHDTTHAHNPYGNEEIFRSNYFWVAEGLKRLLVFGESENLPEGPVRDLWKLITNSGDKTFEVIYQYSNHRDLFLNSKHLTSPTDHLKLDLELMHSAKFVIFPPNFRECDSCKVEYRICKEKKIPYVIARRDRKYGFCEFVEDKKDR